MKPKDEGGLWVVNLSLQNDALLLKQLDKSFNKKEIQWVKPICSKYYPNGTPISEKRRAHSGGRIF